MKEAYKKVLVGAGIAMAGAGLTYLTETIPNVDFGTYTPYVTAVFSVLVNVLRKALEGAQEA